MYSLQLSDLRANLGIQSISGCCHSSDLFSAQVNDVTERLMRRGTWHGTDILMKLCYQSCRLVFPRIVGTVKGARSCCGGRIAIKNNWWSVVGGDTCGFIGDAVLRDDNPRPCYNEITGNTGKYVKVHIVNNKDIGKTVKIFGTKYGNQPLQEQDSAGNWQMGLTITATALGAQTTVLVTRIDAVVKQVFQGRSFLYEVDPTSGQLYDLAMYEPDETNPNYRCSKVMNVGPGQLDADGRCIRQMDCLVKVEFIPVRSDNDFVMIDNKAAMELGIAGLRAERANDDVLSEVKFAKAIRELNAELRNKSPSEQAVIQTNDLSMCGTFSNPI